MLKVTLDSEVLLMVDDMLYTLESGSENVVVSSYKVYDIPSKIADFLTLGATLTPLKYLPTGWATDDLGYISVYPEVATVQTFEEAENEATLAGWGGWSEMYEYETLQFGEGTLAKIRKELADRE